MSNTTRIQFIGDGKLTNFSFPFQIFSTDDVVVYLDNVKQNQGYTITKTEEATATVTFSSPPGVGCFITLIRELIPNRKSHFYEGGALHAKVLNEEFDYQVACIKQLSDTQKRSLVLEPQANASDLTIPQPSGGKALIWNEDGTKLINSQENFSDVINQSITQSQKAIQAAQTATQAAQTATKAAHEATSKALINPMTQTGDIIIGDSNGTPSKLSMGTTGQALGVGEQGLCYQDFAFPSLSNINSDAKTLISSLPMPSDNYVDIALSIGGQFTTPASGYIYVGGSATKNGGIIALKNTNANMSSQSATGITSGFGLGAMIMAKKGDIISLSSDAVTITVARFIYAEGEI